MRIALAITIALLPAPAAAQIPVLGVSPTSLTFIAAAGEGQPIPQSVHVINRGSGTLQWRATPDAEWIRVSPASGTGEAVLTVTLDATRLSAGRYDGRIKVEATDADDSPATIMVTAQLAAPPRADAPPPARATPKPAAAAEPAAAAARTDEAAATRTQPVALTIEARSLPPATNNLPYTQAVPVRGGTPP